MADGPLHNPPNPLPVGSARFTALLPMCFGCDSRSDQHPSYVRDPLIALLVRFFESKGLPALKAEDRSETWYDDWVIFQCEHRLYAQLISPKLYSMRSAEFNIFRFARFLEVFAYYSPAHGYSLQVTFLGLFAILMGDNLALKQEAVAAIEAGGLLAFAISEKRHGSDLLGNEFTAHALARGQFLANGSKYYIGNANVASIITVLGRLSGRGETTSARRAPLVLLALRPARSLSFQNVRKISTSGVRAAFVGEFNVTEHAFPESDVIAVGRRAWDAVLGTVTLGKLFLGFGSIGICEHTLVEAVAHLQSRMLYGKPAIEMPHIRRTMAQAYSRLAAMKLYAYRALDYVHAASASDRRYLLFCAVQKARVSTEGVKVISLLSECIGAKGFESDTYFEMALRDAPLIPSLEGSTHINLKLAAQFTQRYFFDPDSSLKVPSCLSTADISPEENPYLMEARTNAVGAVGFRPFLEAYGPLFRIPTVGIFAKQAKAFQLLLRKRALQWQSPVETPATQAIAQCLSTIAFAQLTAEHALHQRVPVQLVAAMFHTIVMDFSAAALTLAACGNPGTPASRSLRHMVAAPATSEADWDFVADEMLGMPVGSATGEARRTE